MNCISGNADFAQFLGYKVLPDMAFFESHQILFFTFNFGVFAQLNLVALQTRTISSFGETMSDFNLHILMISQTYQIRKKIHSLP